MRSYLKNKELFYYLYDLLLYVVSLIANLFKFNKSRNVIVLTAADSYFFSSLKQLINNISDLNEVKIIKIYDIGLTNSEKYFISNQKKVQLESFDFKAYPSFFQERDKNNKLGAYAWKSAIIYSNTIIFDSDILLWLDSGNIVNNDLKKLLKVVNIFGFYSPISNGKIANWTYSSVKEELNLSDKVLKKPNITGGIVAVNTRKTKPKQLIKQWYEYSILENLISPKGSSRDNHRQDQTLLSIAFFQKKYLLLSPKSKLFFGLKVNQNPDKNLYILDSKINQNQSYKNYILQNYENEITNTITNSKFIWILDISDTNLIKKKDIKGKTVFVNIKSTDNYLNLFNSLSINSIYFFTFDFNFYTNAKKNYPTLQFLFFNDIKNLESIFEFIRKIKN